MSGQVGEDQIIHLQVALYALFLRLYGMYPCNFLLFLRTHFKDKNDPIFCHTIKVLIFSVAEMFSLIFGSFSAYDRHSKNASLFSDDLERERNYHRAVSDFQFPF